VDWSDERNATQKKKSASTLRLENVANTLSTAFRFPLSAFRFPLSAFRFPLSFPDSLPF
jgi:hypothetical protein